MEASEDCGEQKNKKTLKDKDVGKFKWAGGYKTSVSIIEDLLIYHIKMTKFQHNFKIAKNMIRRLNWKKGNVFHSSGWKTIFFATFNNHALNEASFFFLKSRKDTENVAIKKKRKKEN